MTNPKDSESLVAKLRSPWHHGDCHRAADEIERLTVALAKANSQAEHFEREWYLRGDEIERLTAELAREKASRQAAQIQVEALQERINRAGVEKDLEVARLRTALQKIADWDSIWGPYPENNEEWRAMVVVTAREAVPNYAATGG